MSTVYEDCLVMTLDESFHLTEDFKSSLDGLEVPLIKYAVSRPLMFEPLEDGEVLGRIYNLTCVEKPLAGIVCIGTVELFDLDFEHPEIPDVQYSISTRFIKSRRDGNREVLGIPYFSLKI